MKLTMSELCTGAVGRWLSPLLLVLLVAAPGSAQSALERPPNMHGGWVGRSGTVYFHTLHRFTDTGAPLRKVINYPTMLLAAHLPFDALAGVRYATNSELVARVPNEWEFFGRYTPLRAEERLVSVTLGGAYNHAARSFDGELELARRLGPVRVLAAGRAFSNAFDSGDTRFALAAGATLRLHEHVALAGDYARLLDLAEAGEQAAWSAGLQLAIPYTPHTLSLQVSNASTTTLQGSSIGFSRRRWGFEFTVPLTLSRYFGSPSTSAAGQPGGDTGAPAAGSAAAAAAGQTVEVGMTNRLQFTPDTVRIRVGQTVVWRNTSSVMHTVTADPSAAVEASSVKLPEGASPFDSGNMPPGATFQYTFTVPGDYGYFCIPHELAGMVGTVIVTGGDS